MDGFFDSEALATLSTAMPLKLVPQCGACGLYQHCRSPKIPVDGKGKKKILVIGEAPGETEDYRNQPFVGKAGSKLDGLFYDAGLDLREDCWITNSVICRPTNTAGDNRTPTDKEIGWCQPNVINTINELNPRVIIPLGGPAVQSVIGWLWKENVGAIGRWIGWQIPSQKINTWICPALHPSYLLRLKSEVADLLFVRMVQSAAELKHRPWNKGPNYQAQVERILDHNTAAIAIRQVIKDGDAVAFDFETDRLKPDHPDAKIICCALSNSHCTIAYPWSGEAIKATKELLTSKLPKVAHNLKFEHRWTLRMLGYDVQNWKWDTNLGAHLLDSRSNITGLKFQSFVIFGQESYDHHVKPYLKGKTSNTPNRIGELSLNQVLLYCGLDALLELKLAQYQTDLLGIHL